MESPVANFTQAINWAGLERLFSALGLDQFIQVSEIKAFAEDIEATIENPNTLIEDIIGIDVEE